ncbi:MAG: hypothetical protein ACYS9C_09495 [Planctomycetota bacterium]|jgi:hypothetical protein
MSIGYRHSIARWYYYITPLFILLDYIWGVNVRVNVLDSTPLYKSLYYGFCILCGVGMYIAPRYSAVVALFESAINFTMTILGLFLPYVQHLYTDDVLSADWEVASSLSFERIVNLVLVGSVAIFVFKQSIQSIGETFGFTKTTSNHSRRSDAG